ncbi:2-hydroxyacid dehydrogenase [Marinimicrococcus flavescens]|uniref:2-hydroxyacid dehydrogenase n=1 Tax=Marinimicrococcus flavescens TaxID=3031815 RepID=A0AAP3V1X5_9PROT|nr:2-hydroxyacid dehydrogenase [Marinimicrococcus flavescens]
MQRVVFHYDASPALRRRLELLATDGLELRVVPSGDQAAWQAAMVDAEILWHVLEPVTAAIIDGAPRLRLIQKIGVGVNTIDLGHAAARGIAVCNMPGTNSRAVAEMTLALMLAALRRLPQLDRATREGRGWKLPPGSMDQYGEIGGRTVGLLGHGAVPRLLVPPLRALGARVIYWSRMPKPDAQAEWRPFDDVLAEADILSLHLPLTPETEGLLDAAALERLKPGAVLVNTARGGLVDQQALTRALASGRLRAAGLDVMKEEPVPPDDPLLGVENVVLAPHLAWLTPETLERSLAVALENCRRLREGEPLLHKVG